MSLDQIDAKDLSHRIASTSNFLLSILVKQLQLDQYGTLVEERSFQQRLEHFRKQQKLRESAHRWQSNLANEKSQRPATRRLGLKEDPAKNKQRRKIQQAKKPLQARQRWISKQNGAFRHLKPEVRRKISKLFKR